MTQEFEGDLAGAEFWGADLTGATFRDVDLSGARIGHALLVDVDIDATIDRLVVNGVDVTAYVNERDPWYPLRAMLRPADRDGMLAACDALDAEWSTALRMAESLPDGQRSRRVDGEWSFVETLRHLVFAIDKWFTVPVAGGEFHPIGMPNTGSVGFPWPGLDAAADPGFDEVVAARHERWQRFRTFLGSVTAADLDRSIDVLENGPHPLRECIYTVLEEEFWHLRYARRDLAVLTG